MGAAMAGINCAAKARFVEEVDGKPYDYSVMKIFFTMRKSASDRRRRHRRPRPRPPIQTEPTLRRLRGLCIAWRSVAGRLAARRRAQAVHT